MVKVAATESVVMVEVPPTTESFVMAKVLLCFGVKGSMVEIWSETLQQINGEILIKIVKNIKATNF